MDRLTYARKAGAEHVGILIQGNLGHAASLLQELCEQKGCMPSDLMDQLSGRNPLDREDPDIEAYELKSIEDFLACSVEDAGICYNYITFNRLVSEYLIAREDPTYQTGTDEAREMLVNMVHEFSGLTPEQSENKVAEFDEALTRAAVELRSGLTFTRRTASGRIPKAANDNIDDPMNKLYTRLDEEDERLIAPMTGNGIGQRFIETSDYCKKHGVDTSALNTSMCYYLLRAHKTSTPAEERAALRASIDDLLGDKEVAQRYVNASIYLDSLRTLKGFIAASYDPDTTKHIAPPWIERCRESLLEGLRTYGGYGPAQANHLLRSYTQSIHDLAADVLGKKR